MAIAKKLSIIITFCVLVLTPFSVGAIQLQTIEDSNPWPSVHIEFDGSHWYGAGEFQLIVGEGVDAFDTVGYCVELEEGISIPYLYHDVELAPVTFRPNGMDAAWLMNEYAYGLGNVPADADINEIMDAKAALQLAIWDTVHGDNFTVLSDTADSIKTLYTSYINGLAAAGAYDTDFADDFSVAHQKGYQDLLIYNPDDSGAVPEPSAIFLMGCGLISLGLVRFRAKGRHTPKT